MNWYSVNDASADLTFRSSDNILFKIYAKYLEATSAGFAPPPSTVIDQAHIQLEEPSAVLEILFQFVHPPSESNRYRQPDVRNLEPDILFAVAEAAEKYIVFVAINLCMTRMRSVLSSPSYIRYMLTHPLLIVDLLKITPLIFSTMLVNTVIKISPISSLQIPYRIN